MKFWQLSKKQQDALNQIRDHKYKTPIRFGSTKNGDIYIKDADGRLIVVMPKEFNPLEYLADGDDNKLAELESKADALYRKGALGHE